MVLHNYEYFVAIVEAGSLTKAAEHLYVSQPSLSQYLKRLEASLGVELFDRSTSPLRLTYTGERYYQYVLQMMKLDENVRREFQDIKNQTSGRLRLGVALWRGACLLPDVFPTFHQQYPDIHIELTEGRSVQLEAALMNDKIDLAVMNLPRTLDYSKLVSEIVCEERLLIAAPHPAPLCAGSTCRLPNLGRLSCRAIGTGEPYPADFNQTWPKFDESGETCTWEEPHGAGHSAGNRQSDHCNQSGRTGNGLRFCAGRRGQGLPAPRCSDLFCGRFPRSGLGSGSCVSEGYLPDAPFPTIH